MKDELLKIAQEALSDEEVSEIVKDKFKNTFAEAVESAFKWGEAEKLIKKKITEVMVPYIENYDFSEYLLKLDSVLTELINTDACLANKHILENFKNLMLEPDEKSINLTNLFKAWIEQCQKDIETDELEINYDDGVSYCPVECEMRFETEDNSSWSCYERAKIIFENEHDETLNIEIPVLKWKSNKGKPWTLAISNDVMISSIRRLNDFQILLLRLERAKTEIIIDKEYATGDICPEKEPEASFS